MVKFRWFKGRTTNKKSVTRTFMGGRVTPGKAGLIHWLSENLGREGKEELTKLPGKVKK